MRRGIFAGCLIAGAVFAACVGDDPSDTTPTPSPDAGTPTTSSSSSSSSSGSTSSSSSSSSSSSGSEPVDSGPDATPVYDAGPPVWIPGNLPPTNNANTSKLSSFSTPKCEVDLWSIYQAGAPPSYKIYVNKTDATGQACDEPSGAIALATTYATPAGKLLAENDTPLTAHRFVVAWNEKNTPSGSGKNQLFMKELEIYSGEPLHDAIMKTKDYVPVPVPSDLPLLDLYFGDPTEAGLGNVLLKGTGAFFGATGSGSTFTAHYNGFFVTTAQPTTAADSATQQ